MWSGIRFNKYGSLVGCVCSGRVLEIYRVRSPEEVTKRIKRRAKRAREKEKKSKSKNKNKESGDQHQSEDKQLASDEFALVHQSYNIIKQNVLYLPDFDSYTDRLVTSPQGPD